MRSPGVVIAKMKSNKKTRTKSTTGWAPLELLFFVERRVWRVVVLWWRAIARWKAGEVGCFGFVTGCCYHKYCKSYIFFRFGSNRGRLRRDGYLISLTIFNETPIYAKCTSVPLIQLNLFFYTHSRHCS